MEEKVVYINNHSYDKEYSCDECCDTITVWELIDILKDCPMDAKVYVRNDGGYTYCPLEKESIIMNKKDY